MVFSKVFSASTEIVGNKLFGSKLICNGQVTITINKLQQGSPILFVKKDIAKMVSFNKQSVLEGT